MRKSKVKVIAGLLSMVLLFADIIPTGFQVSASEIRHENSDVNPDDSSEENADIVEDELTEGDAEKTGLDGKMLRIIKKWKHR